MKKRLLSLLLTLVLLLGLCPTTAQAKKFTDDPVNDEPYVFTDKDDAILDNDVFARIDAVTDSIQKSGAELTEQDYINKLPEVIEAIKTSDTYVEGTLMQHGVVLIWETTVGMPCCFDPYMEAKLNGSKEEIGTDDPFSEYLSLEALTEKAAKAETEGLPAQADPFGTKAVSNYPSSKEVALIQPYWESKDNNYDSNFSEFGAKWKKIWENICDDVGSSKDYRYTLTDASIDNVAKAIQECGMVIVNSHGTTDYSDGNGDKYSKANCSYICLKTDSGITTADTKKHAGEFDDYYYVIKAKNYTAVSSGAIVNHMTKDAPHSFVYWGMCLGMTTDGMCAPLLEKGVEAVFGFSRSVTFNGDYGYMYYIFERLREGGDLADAVAHAKENWGNWDPNHGDTFQEALEHPAAFPIVVSSQDAYPGRANVQNYQTVNSNWCLYEPGGRDFLVASDIEDLHLTADPAIPGYHIRIYAKVNGQDANLPTDKLSVYWEASLDGVSWQKVNHSDDQGLIIASTEMIGMWLRAKVFPKDQDDHPFTLVTSPIQVVEKLDRLYSPVLPEITRGGTSPSSSVYLKAREGQEYLILTSSAQPTEEDWKNAWHYSSEQTVTLSNTDKPVWNSMNYIWTRFYETDTYNAGEQKKCAKFFWGSASTEELQGTEMEITFAYNHITGDHAEGYWVGDVLKIDAVPIPSRANFEGFAGSSWYYPFLMDQSYGVFYSDLECRNELNADTKYKTVYLHLKKPISEAYISCGPADTGCYTIIEVANDLGHYPVKKVTVPTYSIQIGEVTTRLPFSYTPDKATYNVEHLYVVRDTNVHENGPEGTEPTVIFHANGTMDVDTTPCIEAPYSFRIIDPDTSSVVGKMRVWVGDFDVVPLEGLSFDEPSVSCYAGKSVRVTLRCTPTNGTGLVTWELSNESIATINAPAQIGANYTQAWVKISPDAKSGDLVLVTARSGDYSAVCAITVKAPPTVTSLPKDVTVKEGEKATFTVKATGDDLTYQWYYSAPGETGLTPVSAASGRTASYSLTAKARHDGYRYSCWINGGEKITPEVTLTVLSKPAIKTQPTNTSVTLGAKATFTVEATGGNLSYQWYYRKNSSDSWTKVSAASGKTASYSLTTQQKHDGYQYYCKVTNELGTAKTTTVTLKVKPKITTQPKNVSVVLGKTAEFTVAAEGAKSYQWYYRTSKTGEWKAVSAASGKTASYSLTTAAKHDGYQYRCKVKNTVGYAYTKTVTLKVKPKITTQPKDVTVKAGKTATFTVAAKGGTTYQWYYRTSETGEWKEVSAASGKTASYSLTAKAKHNGYQYRCKVTNKVGYVYTKTVTLKVN